MDLPSSRATPLSTCSDPGGVLNTCHSVFRVAAFRCIQSVGFLLHLQDYPNVHNYTFFGAQYRACDLDPSGFRLPLPGLPADFSADCWLSFSQVGLSLYAITHWVTSTNFMGFLPIPRLRIYLGTRMHLLFTTVHFFNSLLTLINIIYSLAKHLTMQ